LPDSFNDAFEVRHHLLVGEAQNLKSLRHEEVVAALIGPLPFFEIMRLAIKFNDEFRREANEVGDVVSDRDLSAKAEAIDSTGLQVTPQQGFGTRHRLAKLLRPAALALAHHCVRHSWLPPSLALPHKGGGNRKSP
jgi:hypothetical protein